ncbi:MAG: ABC transporter ATP-binding protein/permease [Vicingaceae bacterium]|nr:ABC transporter ATP-binding protein/permease [Vicingaceae bacterium]
MESVSGKAFDYTLMKRILKYITPYKVMFYSTAFLSILLASISVVRPILIQKAVNNNIANKDSLGLYEITIWLIVALIIETLLQYVFTYYGNLIGQNIIKDIRNEVFKRVLSFKLKYYDQTPIGRLVTRTVSDIETIAEMFSDGILVILGDLLKIFAAIICMFYINWDLALITLLPIPLLMIGTSIFKRVIKNAFQDVRNQVSLLNTFVQEHVTGMSIVQIFNREKIESELFSDINKKHRDAHIKTVWAYSVFFPLVEILSALSVALLVWYGFKEISLEIASPGEIFSFTFFIHMLYRPIRQLADRFNSLQMGIVSSERVFKVLDTNYNIANEGTQTIENLNGDITFKNVWFAYNQEDWVLKDISFTIKKGQSLALVGATGAGKSSMINLLGRYYEINKGNIYIDNININDIELNHLRKSMAVVLQDVFLFSDTILNNITLYSDEISEERVIEAAKKIGAHDFISNLLGGYQYNVRERGALLSVGQRQLISFIRAYVHNPRILILDEATSSIDSESEALIKHATEILTQNTTSIIVAHRLSTIQNADKILVIDKGKVVEEGTHQELLKLNGHYKKLYNYQFEEVV